MFTCSRALLRQWWSRCTAAVILDASICARDGAQITRLEGSDLHHGVLKGSTVCSTAFTPCRLLKASADVEGFMAGRRCHALASLLDACLSSGEAYSRVSKALIVVAWTSAEIRSFQLFRFDLVPHASPYHAEYTCTGHGRRRVQAMRLARVQAAT